MVAVWISEVDFVAFKKRIDDWPYGHSVDFYEIYVAILINNLLNSFMSIVAIYMLEKMSRAEWTLEHKDSKEAKQTT